MSDPTPQPKGNRGTTGEPYYMATDYNHIDGGHKISSNHPQEWEREFDELWSMDGIPPTDEKQEVEHLAYQVQKTKSFIRSVVEKAEREGAIKALQSINFMYSDDARRSDLADLINDLEESIAFKIEHPEVVFLPPDLP